MRLRDSLIVSGKSTFTNARRSAKSFQLDAARSCQQIGITFHVLEVISAAHYGLHPIIFVYDEV